MYKRQDRTSATQKAQVSLLTTFIVNTEEAVSGLLAIFRVSRKYGYLSGTDLLYNYIRLIIFVAKNWVDRRRKMKIPNNLNVSSI